MGTAASYSGFAKPPRTSVAAPDIRMADHNRCGLAVTGPMFNSSDTWQLVINTGTTIVTFLMVFLIQNTQNRDTEAIQIKLDELIRATKGAHNALLDLEELEEGVLDDFRRKTKVLAASAREGIDQGNRRHWNPRGLIRRHCAVTKARTIHSVERTRMQTQDDTPRFLLIVRERLRPGSEDAYNQTELRLAAVSATLGCPHPYLALASTATPNEVWWLNAFVSQEEKDGVDAAYARNEALMAEMRPLGKQKEDFREAITSSWTANRPDLSGDAGLRIAGARFFVIDTKHDSGGDTALSTSQRTANDW